jgi:cytidylate kinase
MPYPLTLYSCPVNYLHAMSTYLVVAHQTASAPELLDTLLMRKQEDRRAIFVLLAPATPIHELLEMPDHDSTEAASQALTAAREMFEREGLAIAGAIVGDPDPVKALMDEFIRSRRTYDGIILCTLPFGISRWLSRGLPGEIESLFRVPVTHVIASYRPYRTECPDRIVTFTVRLGSQGNQTARLVANKLGFRYYDWEITAEAASRAGVPPNVVAASEQAQTFVERVLERLLLTGVSDGEEPVGRFSSLAMSSAISALGSRQYRQFVERVVLELAQRGNAVIVGHASQVLLAGQPGVFRVLVTGSQERRAQRVAAEEGRDLDDARKMVRESDYERKSFFKQTYAFDLLNADGYDLILNSDRLSPDAAATAVMVALAEMLEIPDQPEVTSTTEPTQAVS